MTKVAKVFKNGRSQAIRIPKEYRGDTLIIKSKKKNR